jgi:hypothetical protein
LPYLTEVRSDAVAISTRNEGALSSIRPYSLTFPKANDDAELVSLVRRVLTSAQTKAAVLSLISKSNEAVEGKPTDGPESAASRPQST